MTIKAGNVKVEIFFVLLRKICEREILKDSNMLSIRAFPGKLSIPVDRWLERIIHWRAYMICGVSCFTFPEKRSNPDENTETETQAK